MSKTRTEMLLAADGRTAIATSFEWFGCNVCETLAERVMNVEVAAKLWSPDLQEGEA